MRGRPMTVCTTIAAAAALVALPAAPALAMSIQPAYLPAGRVEISGKHGYAEVWYDKRIKRISYVEIYYACRAAGSSKSRYPAYLALESRRHVNVAGGRASSRFTEKISYEFDPKALGAKANVAWTLSGMRISKGGLSGKLAFRVSGPATICPFSAGARELAPAGRPGDKNF
ncbi:MAG: hypothetical protein ACYCUM_00740 [Solirubrobacteraceae bacterium]